MAAAGKHCSKSRAAELELGDFADHAICRIRITFVSRSVQDLEKVCADLIKNAKEKRLKIKGPARMPNKTMRITSRNSPCGQGTNTWDAFELRVHKRVIDLFTSTQIVKQITSVNIEPGVYVEVSICEA
ncbi:hypothetical protein Mapa_016205 [Marchantia paleacea]|nr:hypothetical protein Mapa_016205 [Marchantia paleacea]